MNDENWTFLRNAVTTVNMVLSIVTVTLQIAALEPLRHITLCSFILLLLTITLVCDGILKDDKKQMASHAFVYIFWFCNMLINLFLF